MVVYLEAAVLDGQITDFLDDITDWSFLLA